MSLVNGRVKKEIFHSGGGPKNQFLTLKLHWQHIVTDKEHDAAELCKSRQNNACMGSENTLFSKSGLVSEKKLFFHFLMNYQ